MMQLVRNATIRRRGIFVLGNVAICVALVTMLVIPIQQFFADRDSLIVEKRAVLARLNAVAAQEAYVQSIVSDTNAQLRGGEFLSGPNENVISADLQTRLKGLTESAGARSHAAQALPLKTLDQLKYIGSRIEIFGPLQSIERAVYSIETARPYLFVTGATIRITPSVSRQGGADEPTIQAQLDIFGAAQLGGAKP